jgi:hypothetical protein
MSRIKQLQLVLPETLHQLRAGAVTAQSSAALLDWLGMGARQRLWEADDLQHARLNPWQHSLLHALQPSLRDHGLASAMLHWRGEGKAWRNGTCLHAEPVHLQAGIDDLRLILPPPPTAAEEAQLLISLQPLLSLSGFELQVSPSGVPGSWYLFTERELSLQTYSPHAGIATRIFDVMPQGTHGAELRRLMTEAQMLLHEHPVNEHRARQGVVTLNALWLWGAGPLTLVEQPAAQRILGNHPWLLGLCEHLHASCWPLPPDAQALLSVDADQVLLLLPDEALAQLDTKWLQPVQLALQRGEIGQLDLHLDHWRITLRGGRWRNLRRRMQPSRADLNELLN